MKYLILGASAAGISCAKTLRLTDREADIIVVSQDEKIYSRCMLHHLISGHKSMEDLNFTERDLFEKYQITWFKGKKIIKIDTNTKSVLLDDDHMLNYDKLLIATGASSSMPPIENLKRAKGVYGLRNIEDAMNIHADINKIKEAVVIGAGLVGVDAVIGLMEHDIHISLIELSDRILPLQLDNEAASRYEKIFTSKGIDIYTGVKAKKVIVDEKGRAKALKINSGAEINCQMIVVATGVNPNIDFITPDTIKTNNGIIIDDRCATNIPDIYAAGDVCNTHPIWPLAVKQGITAAYNMAGIERHLDDTFGLKNSLNFMKLQTVSLGMIETPDKSYHVYIQKDKKDYKKIIVKEGIIYGAILQGDISYCGTLAHLIKNKIDISDINKKIFEIDYSDFYHVKENGEYAYA